MTNLNSAGCEQHRYDNVHNLVCYIAQTFGITSYKKCTCDMICEAQCSNKFVGDGNNELTYKHHCTRMWWWWWTRNSASKQSGNTFYSWEYTCLFSIVQKWRRWRLLGHKSSSKIGSSHRTYIASFTPHSDVATIKVKTRIDCFNFGWTTSYVTTQKIRTIDRDNIPTDDSLLHLDLSLTTLYEILWEHTTK